MTFALRHHGHHHHPISCGIGRGCAA